MASAVSSICIEDLELHLDCAALLKECEWASASERNEDPVEEYLHILDIEALADDLCDIAGTLENVLVKITGHPARRDVFAQRVWQEPQTESDDSDSSHKQIDSTIHCLRKLLGKKIPPTFYGKCFTLYVPSPPASSKAEGATYRADESHA